MNKYCSVATSLKAELGFEVVLEHGTPAADRATGTPESPNTVQNMEKG